MGSMLKNSGSCFSDNDIARESIRVKLQLGDCVSCDPFCLGFRDPGLGVVLFYFDWIFFETT